MTQPQREPRRGRPQIGDPDFVWQVGMWARRRDGEVVPVLKLEFYAEDFECRMYPVCVQGDWAGSEHWCLPDGRSCIDSAERDLIKIVGWPK